MATQAQMDQIKADLLEEINSQMELRNTELQGDLLQLRQSLGNEYSGEEDNMDILLNEHMRDITAENRPQMSSAGLESNNKHFKDLSNHELHQIKKIHQEDHKSKPRTILDESLGDIVEKCVNFLTYSFDGYSKAFYEAEMMEDVYDSEKSMYESIKVHLIAFSLFMREDENILYIGILLVLLSIIIYLVNITTS